MKQNSTDYNAKSLLSKYEWLSVKVLKEARRITKNPKLSKYHLFREGGLDKYSLGALLKSSKNVHTFLKTQNMEGFFEEKNNYSDRYLENKIANIRKGKRIKDNEFLDGMLYAFISEDNAIMSVTYQGYYWSSQDHKLIEKPFELTISIVNHEIKAQMTHFHDVQNKNDRAYFGTGYHNAGINRLFLTMNSSPLDNSNETLYLILSTPKGIHKIADYDMIGSLLGLSSREGRPILSMEVYLLRKEYKLHEDRRYVLNLVNKYLALRKYSNRVRSIRDKDKPLSVHGGAYSVTQITYLSGTYYIIRAKEKGGFTLSTLQIDQHLKTVCYTENSKEGLSTNEPEQCTISLDMLNDTKFAIRLNSYKKGGYLVSSMHIRWEQDYEKTHLKQYNYLDGIVTIMRGVPMYQSPFIMYKISDYYGQDDDINKGLIRVEYMKNIKELIESITALRGSEEAERLILIMKKHYSYLLK